jgi:hypothetical protein
MSDHDFPTSFAAEEFDWHPADLVIVENAPPDFVNGMPGAQAVYEDLIRIRDADALHVSFKKDWLLVRRSTGAVDAYPAHRVLTVSLVP